MVAMMRHGRMAFRYVLGKASKIDRAKAEAWALSSLTLLNQNLTGCSEHSAERRLNLATTPVVSVLGVAPGTEIGLFR